MITPSRRTPAEMAAFVRDATEGAQRLFWNGEGDNPYPHFLAHADALVAPGRLRQHGGGGVRHRQAGLCVRAGGRLGQVRALPRGAPTARRDAAPAGALRDGWRRGATPRSTRPRPSPREIARRWMKRRQMLGRPELTAQCLPPPEMWKIATIGAIRGARLALIASAFSSAHLRGTGWRVGSADMAAGGMQRAEQEQMPTVSTPATAMRYRDVAAAADWLCAAFGFEKQTVLADDDGRTLYAQLTFGRALLMLAPVRRLADRQIHEAAGRDRRGGDAELLFRGRRRGRPPRQGEGRRRRDRPRRARTTTSADAATPAAIPKVTSGRSVPTIPGRASSPRPRWRLRSAARGGGRRIMMGGLTRRSTRRAWGWRRGSAARSRSRAR